MVAKVAGGIIGLGLIGTGGVAFVKPEWLGINRETIWKPLSQDKDFSDVSGGTYYNKFGSTHKNYLVGLDKENEGWWEEKYESIKGSISNQGKFKDIKSGYKPENTPLKKVCEDAYKSEDSGFQSTGNAGDDKFKKEEVWKYCSIVGAEPKAIGDNDYDSSGNVIGKTKRAELLSTKNKDNEKLWKLKNDEFFGLGVFASNPKKPGPTDKFFKELFEGVNKNKDALKNKCEAAYALENTESPDNKNQVKEEDVIKYCSAKSI